MRASLFLLLLVLLSPLPLTASDEIWSALVLATNETPRQSPPKPLGDFSSAIEKIFGYNSLYLLGQKKRAIGPGTTEWLVPSREFFFQITCLAREDTHYLVRIELFHNKDLLLTTEARLARNAPLYIRGPQWGKGQLLFLLEVR